MTSVTTRRGMVFALAMLAGCSAGETAPGGGGAAGSGAAGMGAAGSYVEP